ncbi:MAG TPA: hypothetical protein PKV76_09185, partial [Chitinophagales bacterium]|nr:hypothetical protein [Chitinophagales bacterium]
MENIYNKINVALLLIVLLFFSVDGFAQKNLKLRINSVNYQQASGTDCDGNVCIGGDGRIDIAFDIDDGATDVDEACHEGDENT